jgi:hypothetical protein
MKKELWFFTNSDDLLIYTYGSGDTPTHTHKHKDKKSFQKAINALKKDGYKFIKDQAKK